MRRVYLFSFRHVGQRAIKADLTERGRVAAVFSCDRKLTVQSLSEIGSSPLFDRPLLLIQGGGEIVAESTVGAPSNHRATNSSGQR